jgi:isopentenyl-diphosphate delta-isomerase
VIAAVTRRVRFELNIDLKPEAVLQEVGVFRYRAASGREWTEWEVDHVVFGFYDVEEVDFNVDEVSDVRWVSKSEMGRWLEKMPQELSPWLHKIWGRFLAPSWDKWVAAKKLAEKDIPKGIIDMETG